MAHQPCCQWLCPIQLAAKTFFKVTLENPRLCLDLTNADLSQSIGLMVAFWAGLLHYFYPCEVVSGRAEQGQQRPFVVAAEDQSLVP
eukprot:6468038-Amphidinium_carterae.1